MTVEVFDTFVGTAGTSITTYNPAWEGTTVDGNLGLNVGKLTATGAARGDGSGAIASYSYSPAVSGSNVSVIGNVVKKDHHGYELLRLFGRCSSGGAAANAYYVQHSDKLGDGVGKLSLQKFVGSVTTTLGSTGVDNLPDLDVIYKLELRLLGSSIKVFLDDVEVISATDTALAAAGRVGFSLRQFGDSDAVGIHLLDITGDVNPVVLVNLAVAPITQVNLLPSFSISITKTLTVDNLTQTNVLPSTTMGTMHDLLIDSLTQASDVGAYPITQDLTLAVGSFTQANLLSAAAITVGVVTAVNLSVGNALLQKNLLASVAIQQFEFDWIPEDLPTEVASSTEVDWIPEYTV